MKTWGWSARRSCSTGDHLPWGLLPTLALLTGLGLLLLVVWTRYPSMFL